VRRIQMTIEFQCQCGRPLQAPEEYAGRMGRCPACQNPITVPETTGASPTRTTTEDLGREEQDEKMPQQETIGKEKKPEGFESAGEEQLREPQQRMSWSRSPMFLILAIGLVVLLLALIGLTVVTQEKPRSDRVVALEEVTSPSEKSQSKNVHPAGTEPRREMNRVEETLPMRSLLTPEEEVTEETVIEISEFETAQELAGVKEAGRGGNTLREESIEEADPMPEGTQETMSQTTKTKEETRQKLGELREEGEHKVATLKERPESIEKVGSLSEGVQRTVPETSTVEEDETRQEMAETNAGLKPAMLEEKSEPVEEPGPLPGSYTVNLASFRERARADRFVQELRQKGFEAFCWEIDLPEKGKWHRVSVGNFPTLEYAKNFVAQEKLKESYSLFIIRIPGA
jgi:cell division septation protein DedD